MTLAGSSPVLTRFEYSACLSAMSPPHVKHLTGMSIFLIPLSVILSIIKTITVYTKCQRFSGGAERNISAAAALSSSGLILEHPTDSSFVFFFCKCICFGLEPILDQNPFCENSFTKFVVEL